MDGSDNWILNREDYAALRYGDGGRFKVLYKEQGAVVFQHSTRVYLLPVEPYLENSLLCPTPVARRVA